VDGHASLGRNIPASADMSGLVLAANLFVNLPEHPPQEMPDLAGMVKMTVFRGDLPISPLVSSAPLRRVYRAR
jgi:hypothetical protein